MCSRPAWLDKHLPFKRMKMTTTRSHQTPPKGRPALGLQQHELPTSSQHHNETPQQSPSQRTEPGLRTVGPWLVRGGSQRAALLSATLQLRQSASAGSRRPPPHAWPLAGAVNMDGAASTTPPRDLSDPSSSSILCSTCERMTGRARPVKAQERRFGPAPSRPVY